MRITNNMIVGNTKTNINGNKLLVDKYNTQMSTQKKISRASEDPVVAIRSLRFSTTQSHLNQYSTNIDDAQSWLDVTQTALINMKTILSDIRTQCVNGSTDTLTADDRNTIMKQLKALSEQVYSEGNADYAGRTIFTGYRTSSNLTFNQTEKDTAYEISQTFTSKDLEEHRYYTGDVDVPTTIDATTLDCDEDVTVNNYKRLRLAYSEVDYLSTFEAKMEDGKSISIDFEAGTVTATQTDAGGGTTTSAYGTVAVYDTYEDWEAATGCKFADATDADAMDKDTVVFIKSTGEIIFRDDVSNDLLNDKAEFSVTYMKKGFENGELRPEYYFDCRDVSKCLDADGKIDEDLAKKYGVEYTKENQEIKYTIATNTTLTINTQADQIFSTDIKRDVDELITVVSNAISAHEKVDSIKLMMTETQYEDEESQAKLQTYLDAAKKEADYADDNMQKTYSAYITRFDNYFQSVNLSITNVGSTVSRLQLTQTRVENQQTSIESLKSENEDRDISDIIIDYYAAYNAYTSSLTAAGKIGDQSLLNYI